MWKVDPDHRSKMDDTRPVPLCPGGKYEILPGMIWISSGFLHGGKLQENPPYRAVPKWTDGFQILMGGTFSFDNGYCLNEVLEGWDYWESLVGKTESMFFALKYQNWTVI